jgi:hypothetical protein
MEIISMPTIELEQELAAKLMSMGQREPVEVFVQTCAAAEISKQEAMNAEKRAMIRCVKMISEYADLYFEKWSSTADKEGDDIGAVKAAAFDIRDAATPICKELGMTIPECLSYDA